ncbi:hypothetical protein ABZT10_31915, partial [Streptomyces sp900116325]
MSRASGVSPRTRSYRSWTTAASAWPTIRHLWSTTLFDELKGLGRQGGYSTFTRGIRATHNCPHCDQPITIVALLATPEPPAPPSLAAFRTWSRW